MTYQQGTDDEGPEWLGDEWPTDEFPRVDENESPYPESINLFPLIVGVLIILTLFCWWLAYNSTSIVSGLLFGLVAPFLVGAFGMRLARGSSKRAEEAHRWMILRALNEPLQSSPRQVGKYKLPHEQMLFCSRRHPISLLGRKRPRLGALIALTWVFLAVLTLRLGAPLVTAGLVLVALPVVGYQYFGWRNEWFWISNFRIVRSFGIIQKKTKMVPKTKIEGVTCETTGTARFLALIRFIWVPYGHIHIETAEDELENHDTDNEARIQEMKYLPGAEHVTTMVIEWNQPPE